MSIIVDPPQSIVQDPELFKMRELAESDEICNANDSLKEYVGSLATYTKAKEIKIKETIKGRIRVTYEYSSGATGYVTYYKLYKNGSAWGVERTSNTTTWAKSIEDFSVTLVKDDLIQVYYYGDRPRIRNFRLGYVFIIETQNTLT